MATPLAHKGATAGAKVQAMTIVDFLVQPDLIAEAWDYFENVQTKAIEYAPLIRPADRPAIELNKDIMAEFRPAMREFYYDPARYDTYPQPTWRELSYDRWLRRALCGSGCDVTPGHSRWPSSSSSSVNATGQRGCRAARMRARGPATTVTIPEGSR